MPGIFETAPKFWGQTHLFLGAVGAPTRRRETLGLKMPLRERGGLRRELAGSGGASSTIEQTPASASCLLNSAACATSKARSVRKP